MAEEIIKELVSVLIKTLVSSAYKNVMCAKDLDSHIKRLQQLKTTIEARMLDARSSESCTHAQKDVFDKLDCALEDLNHFLDAKAAKTKQKEIKDGNKFIKETRWFFSKSNQLVSPFRDAHVIQDIIKNLESISRDQALVRDIIAMPSSSTTQTVASGSLWSDCHILSEVVIGRDKDRDAIVNMILDDSLSSYPLSVASIVGIGGVGKTTLAKYVYNDERVKSSFDIRVWISATKDIDVQKMLLDIVATIHDQTPACNVGEMYDIFKQAIGGKKLLLVIDNVWDQEGLRQKWLELRSLLSFGADGSKVLVTTRNKKVARIMDSVNPNVLGDLTEENSWLLFKRFAFTECQDPGLEVFGREILHMIPKVPLVLRSIGGHLSGKCSTREWMAFRNDLLENFSAYGRDVERTLMLSYDQLDYRLKHCVAYCSLFPKWYTYDEHELVRLWISLGYIKPSYGRQCLEDAARECILMLVAQGWFVIENFTYLSMHNLMHDLVVAIADYKYKMVGEDESIIDDRVRHLSIFRRKSGAEPSKKVLSAIFKLKQLQSLLVLKWPVEWSSLWLSKKVFDIFPRLIILRLSEMGIKKVPNSLGELITLRYLDLSGNPISSLPNSITQLVELLSLDISYCRYLHEFPTGISKLVKLRHIRNEECPALVPKGVTSLTDLQTLSEFRLIFEEGYPRENDCGLTELKVIINRVKDKMTIFFIGDAISGYFKAKDEEWETEGGNLKCLELNLSKGSTKGDEMVVEALQLNNPNLRHLRIEGYKGERLPRWMKNGIHHHVENLVEVSLHDFEGCKSLGFFGGLIHLRSLCCYSLKEVECMEGNDCGVNNTNAYAPLFPSLEYFSLNDMPKLKKWYKESNGGESSILLAPKFGFPKLTYIFATKMEFVLSMAREFGDFSSLVTLRISNCEDLKAIPDGIPNLSNLNEIWLHNGCDELKQRCQKPMGEDWPKIKHIPYVDL